ncbi:MAG: hypothetical protein WCN88_03370 [Candidatus Falkowbacteria bacterium]
MGKYCKNHQCFNKDACLNKFFLWRLALCWTNNTNCPNCALNPYGKYDLEDVLLP